TTGSNNVAVGYGTLLNNTVSSYNVAMGDSALFSNNGVDGYNTAVGSKALFANTSGNNNTAIGKTSMLANTTGILNTAVGINTLSNNIAGNSNTATGARALQFTNADFNTATGASALRFNSTGLYNSALGYTAAPSNTTGNQNTAVGAQSMFTNTTGSNNTAAGVNALYTSATSIDNTAIGTEALFDNTADGNTAVGRSALFHTVSGPNNTAVGVAALQNNNTGYRNTAIGAGADCSFINLYNTTVIGYGAIVDDFNKVRIGNTAVLSIGGQVGWTTFSDGRFKRAVQEDIKGIEFIKLLRPVSYTVDIAALDNHYRAGRSESNGNQQTNMPVNNKQPMEEISVRRESGFIAQEVEQAALKAGFSFSGVDKPSSDNALYGLRYSDFVVPLVKAIQEQQALIETLEHKVELLEKKLALLK
ncbi:MAG TPA: tail fiber domain-containing protein, partial [Chitinophagaceae bacterium]|nr:tail fiber domain-containing protein [Chitinophagaceae bacterium]